MKPFPVGAELALRAWRRWLDLRMARESQMIELESDHCWDSLAPFVHPRGSGIADEGWMLASTSERRLLVEWMLDAAECFLVMRRIILER